MATPQERIRLGIQRLQAQALALEQGQPQPQPQPQPRVIFHPKPQQLGPPYDFSQPIESDIYFHDRNTAEKFQRARNYLLSDEGREEQRLEEIENTEHIGHIPKFKPNYIKVKKARRKIKKNV